jgi:hypothetical protein
VTIKSRNNLFVYILSTPTVIFTANIPIYQIKFIPIFIILFCTINKYYY